MTVVGTNIDSTAGDSPEAPFHSHPDIQADQPTRVGLSAARRRS